jgi:hypothetical protein
LYYDTVTVSVSDSLVDTSFDYLVVCDQGKLRAFDVNFLVLFAIAVLILIIAIKTPPLLILKDMTEEEEE